MPLSRVLLVTILPACDLTWGDGKLDDTGSRLPDVPSAVDDGGKPHTDAPVLASAEPDRAGRIRVWRSLGDGFFAPWEAVDVTSTAVAVQAVADIDDDGVHEILCQEPEPSGRLWVVDREPDGSWLPATRLEIGFRVKGSGDLDGDGRRDLFGWTDEGAHGCVALRTGPSAYAVDCRAFDLASTWTGFHQRVPRRAADLDGDGLVDLVVGAYGSPAATTTPLYLHRGDGAGRFGAPEPIGVVPGGVNGLDLGDLDGDGFVDIVAGLDDDGDPGQIWAMFGSPAGFADPEPLVDAFPTNEKGSDEAGYGQLGLFDWDEDGALDLVARTHTWQMSNPILDRWRGNGEGGMTDRARIAYELGAGTTFGAP